MEIEVTVVSLWDKLKGVKVGMRGYITNIAFEYLGHRCYRVELYDYGMFHLYDYQIDIAICTGAHN